MVIWLLILFAIGCWALKQCINIGLGVSEELGELPGEIKKLDEMIRHQLNGG